MYRSVGQSGLWVFPLALGTMQFGWSTDEASAFEILDAFLEAGGNLIDTADIYSTWAPGNPGGVAEEILGRWLRSRDLPRERVVLATKVQGPMGEGGREGRTHPLQREGLSRRWILKACEDSLRRLGVEYIDLYQIHWVDPQTPIEETLSALNDLVRRGYVRYLGVSNFSAWRLMQALWVADRKGFERPISLQPEYSLVQPTRADFERELARVCSHYGIGVLPYSPLAGGFLTGKYRPGAPLPESVRARGIERSRFSEQNWAILAKALEIAEARGVPPAQIALAWLLAKPWVSAPIVGANHVRQLKELLPAAQLSLSPEEVQALDEVSDWPHSRTEREV
jgi:aryl-alcohol dehydrogenase-like predicted oxidoreductase